MSIRRITLWSIGGITIMSFDGRNTIHLSSSIFSCAGQLLSTKSKIFLSHQLYIPITQYLPKNIWCYPCSVIENIRNRKIFNILVSPRWRCFLDNFPSTHFSALNLCVLLGMISKNNHVSSPLKMFDSLYFFIFLGKYAKLENLYHRFTVYLSWFYIVFSLESINPTYTKTIIKAKHWYRNLS